MYYDEFIAIRDAQLRLGSEINITDWKQIEKALFHQRPLKSQKHLVGRCTLEFDSRRHGRRRCTIALPPFQEYRLLQGVNHLRITLPNENSVPLTPEQRSIIVQHLQMFGDLLLTPPRRRSKTSPAATSVMSLLDLPKGTGFSLKPFQDGGDSADDGDDDDDTKLIGNRTTAKLRPIFDDRWESFSDDERDQIILQVLYITNPESLKKLATAKWNLSVADAEALSRVTLEDGFGGLSKKAIRKLLPELRDGISYAEARKKVYPESFKAREPQDNLPPLNNWNSDVRNPAVIRALSELRKVVNGLVREYGKPEQIHLELARDLKRSRKERQEVWKKNEEQRRRREKAVREILNELGDLNPNRPLVDKWLLAEECNWECPYTGKRITARTLESFDVEHIYPRQYLDDSFVNKTVCDHDFNRNRKKNRLPSEILHGDEYEAVLGRMRNLNGALAETKLKRFLADSVPEDFVARQLNDTRYNSRLAADFLGTLYGGRSDADKRQRIVTPTGNLTWMLRTGWELNSILSDTDDKDRRDNRHHAVDAVCIALATQRSIQITANLAETNFRPGVQFNKFLRDLPKAVPWKTFLADVRESIEKIIVSHRPTRTIAGPLHAANAISKPFVKPTAPESASATKRKTSTTKPPAVEYRVRKSLDKLYEKDILGEAIVDPNVRAAVQQKFQELCDIAATKADRTPAKMWNDLSKLENFPRLPPSASRVAKGESTHGSPIFKVRISTDTKPRTIGTGVRQRQIASGKDSNYATMLYSILDKDGKEVRWEHEIITRLDAHLRLSANGGGRKKRRQRGGRKKEVVAIREVAKMTRDCPERVLVPRTTEEFREMALPPFKLKAGETVKYLFSLVKNDMVELDGPDGTKQICRIASISLRELQLCPHMRGQVNDSDRTPWRFQSLQTFRARNPFKISVSPLGLRGIEIHDKE